MSPEPDESIGKARKVFRRRKILTLGEVAELIQSSGHTARRRLKQWRAHTSYNQNGRYYTLPEVPKFDPNGLWHWRDVFFSQYGNLEQEYIRSGLGLTPRLTEPSGFLCSALFLNSLPLSLFALPKTQP